MNTSPAALFRRLLIGFTPNGEIDSLEEPFQSAARILAAAEPGRRGEALNALPPEIQARVIACIDDEAIETEVAPADEPEPWPPMRLDESSQVKPFPLDVLPSPARALAEAGSQSIGCAPDFLAVPALVIAAGAIGRSSVLLLKNGYAVGATLYAACVGPPSDGKTPAMKFCAAPVRAIDHRLAADHRKAIKEWEAACAKAITERLPTPQRPKRKRIDIDDTTTEAIPRILQQNPRGLVMIRDELSAYLRGMNQYKSGGRGHDRSIACKIWSGDRIVTDRVSHENQEPVACDDPAVSITGGLPPDILFELGGNHGVSDGFIDRYLFSFPDARPVAPWNDRGISPKIMRDWTALITRLWDRPLVLNRNKPQPSAIIPSTAAKECWRLHFNAHCQEMNGLEFDPELRGPWGKMREYAGRFALILTLMHYAAEETDPTAVPAVEAENVDRAWELVAYFKSHALRVQSVLHGASTRKGKAIRAVTLWLSSQLLTRFSIADLRHARRWIDDDALSATITHLISRGVIRPTPAALSGPKGGRPPSPTYDVNPLLHH